MTQHTVRLPGGGSVEVSRPRDEDFANIDSAPNDACVWLRWANGSAGFGRMVGPMWAVCPMPGAPPLGSSCEDERPSLWAPMEHPDMVIAEIEAIQARRANVTHHAC